MALPPEPIVSLDISVLNNVIKVYGKDFICYPKTKFEKYSFNKDGFQINIAGANYKCDILELTIGGVPAYDFDTAHEMLSAILNPCCIEPTVE